MVSLRFFEALFGPLLHSLNGEKISQRYGDDDNDDDDDD